MKKETMETLLAGYRTMYANLKEDVCAAEETITGQGDEIAALREEIAEYREILSGIEGSLDDLPYWELASGILEIDEQRVTDQFQWFRSWMQRNGLTEAVNPSQGHMAINVYDPVRDGWCSNLAVDLATEAVLGHKHLTMPDDKPRLDGHHDGEGYDPRNPR